MMNSFKRLFCAFVALCLASAAQAGGFDDGMAAFDKGDFKGAYAQWLPLAENGDARAQGWLGRLYFMGLGVERNDAIGLEWFRKSASQNDALGQAGLGIMYIFGYGGLPKDLPEGLRLTHQAAENGIVFAQLNMGVRYRYGQGVEEDKALSNTFLLRAAESISREAREGHLEAKVLAAYFFTYDIPDKVDFDAKQAAAWLKEAAQAGYPLAQNVLAKEYAEGSVLVEENETLAFEWYEKSAAQGDARGQYELSEFYNRGRVVAPNQTIAAELLKKAAAHDHVGAQYFLGLRYAEGDGVERNNDLAVYWLQKAAASGFGKAQIKLDEIKAGKQPPSDE